MADANIAYAAFAPSLRAAPEGTRLHALDPDTHVGISIYLKPRGLHAGASRVELAERRRVEHAEDFRRVSAFANAAGLAVAGFEPGRRLVRLVGTASQAQAAFRTDLSQYEHEGVTFRARTGALQLPADLHEIVEAVLGLDTRPAAQPRYVRADAAASHAGSVSYLPNAVGAIYGFPGAVNGTGECIALVELGGGFRRADIAASFKAMNLPSPHVVAVSVDSAHNRPTPDDGADAEVALDIQVAGGIAPGATIAVYFAPNTDAGFADAISTAVHDVNHAPGVVSISWGSAEADWTGQAVAAMNSALQDADTLAVSVFVASGDSLGTDSVKDGKVHVDFPASSPHAIGCGGTRLEANGTRVTSEVVWNDGSSGTGGGVSALFGVPAFQAHAKLPASVSTGKPGRGVPDVAGNASPETGYEIVVNGRAGVVGGTSAVAPLWAGLTALLNQQNGKKLGFFLPALYTKASAMREITTGNNKPRGTALGYDAGQGWNACAGLGVPGAEIAKVLK